MYDWGCTGVICVCVTSCLWHDSFSTCKYCQVIAVVFRSIKMGFLIWGRLCAIRKQQFQKFTHQSNMFLTTYKAF